MDLFTKYFTDLHAGATAKLPWHAQMAHLIAAKTMMTYPEHRYRTMRYIAKLCWQMGLYGEAYRAALVLPAGELGDCGQIIKAVETDGALSGDMICNLEIITLCNLRCPMCCQTLNKDKGNNKFYAGKGKIMALADFKRIWGKISSRVKLLVLVGQGETFMHPNIYDILEHVAPTPVYIDTNANIKLEADRLVQSSLQTLVFSVDGVDQRTYEPYRVGGNFQKAVDNIRAVVEAKKRLGRGPVLTFKYIVFKHNEAYLDDVQKMAQELGVDKIQIVPCLTSTFHDRKLIRSLFPHGRHRNLSRIRIIDYGHDMIHLSADHMSPYCTGGMNNPNIQIDGMVTPCCSSMVAKEVAYMGNILDQSFENIWHSEAYREIRLGALRNRYQYECCRKCSRDQVNVGRLFDGTELEYPSQPAPSDDVLNLDELKVEPEYAAQLLRNGLIKDIEYYRASGALSPEAEALLAGFGGSYAA